MRRRPNRTSACFRRFAGRESLTFRPTFSGTAGGPPQELRNGQFLRDNLSVSLRGLPWTRWCLNSWDLRCSRSASSCLPFPHGDHLPGTSATTDGSPFPTGCTGRARPPSGAAGRLSPSEKPPVWRKCKARIRPNTLDISALSAERPVKKRHGLFMDLITTTSELAAVCARLARHPVITVDTEFLRETTYYPLLCVVQMASAEEAVVIDTLAEGIDLKPFFALMADEKVLKVFHAARQDIEIVWHQAGIVPHPIFDTQVAAMVLGYGDSIAYDQLVERIAGHRPDKTHRFTDWSRRPLTEDQMHYAVSDVTHLRDVFAALDADLKKRGRSDWVSEEMEALPPPNTYDFHPERAWERLKTRVRKPKELAVLMEVAAWREQEAQSRDVPRSRVLKDDAVGDIATHAPTSLERLANLRSLPKGFDRSKWGADIVAAVQRGIARDPATLPKIEKPRSNSNGAAIVELLKVLLRMTSERHAVATKVIATVDDLEQIAADDNADVGALHGWRRELFGEAALALKQGRLALAIEKGRVVRVDRA